MEKEKIKEAVRENYKKIAKSVTPLSCCEPECCSPMDTLSPEEKSQQLGYTEEELASIPEGSNLGLGCGNPTAIASLSPGETVLDLGSGGGFDVFLAANQVGETGQAIGVDFTPEMISKARENSQKGNYTNVDFRLGEIEHLPVPDSSIDVIISNCVINLSPEKPQVLKEAYRVLKPGGRIAFSDIVRTGDMPSQIKEDLELYSGCVSGAASNEEWQEMLQEIGFKNINIEAKSQSKEVIKEWTSGGGIENYIVSANIEAVK